MAGRAYLSQRRDRRGRWTGGGVGKLISSGRRMDEVDRYVTKGGLERRTARASAEDVPMRAKPTTASDRRREFNERRGKIKGVSSAHKRYHAGQMSHREKWDLEYASPQAREKAMRETGTYLRPKKVQVDMVRGRAKRSRDVTYNRLSGRYVASTYNAGFQATRPDRVGAPDERGRSLVIPQRRPGRTGAAMRAKLATPKQPAKPSPDAIQTDTGTFISREAAAVAMFGPEEAARRLAKKAAKKAPAKKAPRAKLATPEYVGRRRADP